MHLRPWAVVVAGLALVACGSGAGSLDGSVRGHDVSLKEAVFLDFGNNQVFLAAGNEDHVCEVVTGYAPAGTGFAVLETLFANWSGTAPDPVLEGTYVQAASFSAPGLYSLTLLQWGDRCIAYGTLGATSGTVRIESFGGLKEGAHLIADVDLKFGDDHLSGRIDAHYCQAPATRGTACSQ